MFISEIYIEEISYKKIAGIGAGIGASVGTSLSAAINSLDNKKKQIKDELKKINQIIVKADGSAKESAIRKKKDLLQQLKKVNIDRAKKLAAGAAAGAATGAGIGASGKGLVSVGRQAVLKTKNKLNPYLYRLSSNLKTKIDKLEKKIQDLEKERDFHKDLLDRYHVTTNIKTTPTDKMEKLSKKMEITRKTIDAKDDQINELKKQIKKLKLLKR